ncbi:putative beta-galactosidase A [Aspergillus californicus]
MHAGKEERWGSGASRDSSRGKEGPNNVFNTRSASGKPLQDLVTFDNNSLLLRGERIFLLSAEYHPFRLPVPSLWLDNFQKIKAMGFNTVSFYTYWPLHEGRPGEFTASGVFALEQWFQAASDAGIYLIARPGPYINSESSGGGLPGWVQRVEGANGTLRTSEGGFLAATDNYMRHIGRVIAKAQITNGGPVILVQAENEYSQFLGNYTQPQARYMQYVIDQLRDAGVVVPITNNDAFDNGYNAPGTGEGEVDIYGYDNYPIGVGCSNLYDWPAGELRNDYWERHVQHSPSTPHAVMEFQSGSGAGWGETNDYDVCAESVNEVFRRVVYKNLYAAAVKVLNLYMVTGSTNWGNIGSPHSFTSYDVGSPIREDRTLDRESYSELKLQGQFFKVSPAYLASSPDGTNQTYTNDTAVTGTRLSNDIDKTSFYVVRHTAYQSHARTPYRLHLHTSLGNLTVPSLGQSLVLDGRDSKIHVADYNVGRYQLLYSSAEIFTWKKYEDKTILILYGGPNEAHEAAIATESHAEVIEGPTPETRQEAGLLTFAWDVSASRTILKIDDLYIYLLDRNTAYRYFVPLSPSKSRGAYGTHESNPDAIIIKAGYLVRSAKVDGSTLSISADFNETTEVEIVGAVAKIKTLKINGETRQTTRNIVGNLITNINYKIPAFHLPNLNKAEWRSTNGLPEIQPGYDDSAWPHADHNTSNNHFAAQLTPTVLSSSEYGFHAGYLVYRGHFTASGTEEKLKLTTSGGSAFGSSAWLNGTYLGSWVGEADVTQMSSSFTLAQLETGENYVVTVVVDNNGQEMNFSVGSDDMKAARGIRDYSLDGTQITWKITGNLGGENYQDRIRGPLNEGGSYPERQGWHQPNPPSSKWTKSNPISAAVPPGISFFTTETNLNIPKGWDIPLEIVFDRDGTKDFRVQLFVNGWQFGKLIRRLGPQSSFPVPEGILDYRGRNTVALTYWSQENGTVATGLKGVSVRAGRPVLTGRSEVEVVKSPGWERRRDAY